MKRINYLYIFLLVIFQMSAQNEASFWYFGQNAGVRFDADQGTVTAVTDGQLNTLEGCTSISDVDGNLLFYSDGSTIWNRNHQIMLNGTGLRGDDSSTSSGLIVPKPQDPDFYYLFTVDEPHHNNTSAFPNMSANDGVNDGFMYSRINILDDGGLGAVDAVEKNIPLITYDPTDQLQSELKCSEKITAVRADDCSSFWVLTHFGDTFYAFKVDENGVNTTPITSTVGPNIPIEGYRRNALGYLKASPDGSKLVVAHFGESTILAEDAGGGIYLFDFNNDTGIVSNALELYSAQNNNSPYGVEFSAENRKVYATVGFGPGGGGASQVLQWDLESTNIPNSQQVVHSSNTMSAGALQLGIDRRIYRAQYSFAGDVNISRYLGVIENPEADGQQVIYNEQGVFLSTSAFGANTSRIGLPPFIQSLFNSQTDIIRNGISTTELRLCTGDTYTLQADDLPGADYVWSLDGTPIAGNNQPLLFIDAPGFYEVFIEPNNGECPIEGSAVVGIFDIPVANNLSDVIVCDDEVNDGFTQFTFNDKDQEALETQDPNQFIVGYYESVDDAINKANEITFPYLNTSNPQTIIVRVDNVDNSNCFDLNSFELEVFNTPQIAQIDDEIFCDNFGDVTDGIANVDLNLSIPLILGSQDASEIEVTFHATPEDAEMDNAPLPTNYINSIAFNETLYIRAENTLNQTCYTTRSFNLIVNPIPEANDVSVLQCDEDGIPDGFTTFNINQLLEDITGGNPQVEVAYYLSQADADAQADPIDGDAFENFVNPQVIVACVTDTATGCFDFGEVTLEVSATATNDASLTVCDDDGQEDGFASFQLSDADSEVLLGAPTGLDVVYYATYDDALIENNPLGGTFANTVAFNQTIYARVENDNACFGISEVELTVFELPNIETQAETIYCLNFFPETVVLDGGVIDDAPSNYSYDWSTGENTTSIEVNQPGIYTVTVTNTNGCFKDRTINVLPSNIATITDIEVVDATRNNSITVLVTGEGVYEYALDNPNGPYQESNVFNDVQPGLYTVYVRDRNNCGIAEELVSVIGFPKYFTPNGDDNNDFWQVYGITEQFQADTSILIFDRYGKLLKELDPLGPGWDGTFNGNKMPTSDYWFKVNLQDGRTFTSHFTLKR
ncbi:T9SS type B sorting domain-containing protein [Winogradskyella alexanderae]|uniref:T9SS type B sorting domain-containing protein n=1 Tax=Winogradskyella alexanderae TaxID=2877123 RepID=A0ABS7XTC5_9FLAO|nr:T9SS type B sorting domain-containing protein [Winogradskyella alexanderae]MCA0132086.1 T9SS type B sorting domain-containing protein [Winogradskyella alexanderae]